MSAFFKFSQKKRYFTPRLAKKCALFPSNSPNIKFLGNRNLKRFVLMVIKVILLQSGPVIPTLFHVLSQNFVILPPDLSKNDLFYPLGRLNLAFFALKASKSIF